MLGCTRDARVFQECQDMPGMVRCARCQGVPMLGKEC